MRIKRVALLLAPALVCACAQSPDRHTLEELNKVEPDVADVIVDDGLDQAITGYSTFLEETPESELTPDAMRRLADLKVEKVYGILGDGALKELPAPQAGGRSDSEGDGVVSGQPVMQAETRTPTETDEAFEARATAAHTFKNVDDRSELVLPGDKDAPTPEEVGPLEAIALYDRILTNYPHYPNNDQVLYQKARTYEELGRIEKAMAVMDRLVVKYPHSRYLDEVQFRRAEYFFTRKKYLDAEDAYAAIISMGEGSEYYELALYKLGWALYKQDMYEEALDRYVALLDYKVSIGYDFDQTENESDERRIADTYRVISLSFSVIGGPEAVTEYFAANGTRSYEDRVYSHLGEFYFEKLRYHDAASSYRTFVELNPLHRSSPDFNMRVVEIYDAGGFPQLVLESKKEFASNYALSSAYWQHFAIEDRPEVRDYLKANIEDLANHYHALYQEETLVEERLANYDEAVHWYWQYLGSFPEDSETPGIHYQLADLLLEHEDFGAAALAYESTAYEYALHDRAAEAGYAAIYAHREHQKVAVGAQVAAVRRDAVTSTLRFIDAFPTHARADVVLGAAVDDLYDMQEYALAIDNGRKLIEDYPEATAEIRRSAWVVVAHASFDIAEYVQAEEAYLHVLDMTSEDDDTRQAVVENLAASIYKQGEQANALEDYRAAADHFLRIRQLAPTSDTRPAAEYDAGAALMRLEDWSAAAQVLDAFRSDFPDHELNRDATRQIAHVYQEDGQLARAAQEYERVSAETEDAALSRESLLLAGELYEEAAAGDQARDVYLRYVEQFPDPVEINVETRYKVAGMYRETADLEAYHAQLQQIVAIDGDAGEARTARTRYLAAQSSLVLSEALFRAFDAVDLVQPFEASLQEKQRQMDETVSAFERLVNYEVAEVTAAATFYMAETYRDFSQSLLDSERPSDLAGADLQDYEMVLEEEAWPFEERAIEFHEKNLELMVAGHYSAWTERSLDELAALVPGRYAKFEESSGLLVSIDSYSYRSPSALNSEGADAAAEASAEDSSDAVGGSPAVNQAEDTAPPDAVATG
jgi:tetratricopeptide (TPR) repeat protein